MQSLKIPAEKSPAFLKALQSQCVPWNQQPFIASGHIICKVEGLSFTLKLEPLHASTVVYLHGRAHSDGLISWETSGPAILPIVFLALNAVLWVMFISLSNGSLESLALSVLGGIILSGFTLLLYLFIDKRNKSIGEKLVARVIETANSITP